MLFIEKIINVARNYAYIGMIIDTNIHSNPFKNTRKYLLDHISIEHIVDNISVFDNVGSSQLITT